MTELKSETTTFLSLLKMDITPQSIKAKITSIEMLLSRKVIPSGEELSFVEESFSTFEEKYARMIEFYTSSLGMRESDFRVEYTPTTKSKNKVEKENYILLHPGQSQVHKTDTVTSVGKFLNLMMEYSRNNTRLLSNIYYSVSPNGKQELLLVYFSGSDQYNTKESGDLTGVCAFLGIKRIIVITKFGTTTSIQKNFARDVPRYLPKNSESDGYMWQHFEESELQCNISFHFLQPKDCKALDDEERLELVSYGIALHSLPCWLISDPLTRYYGFGVDDVVFYRRDVDVPDCLIGEEYNYIRIVDETGARRKITLKNAAYIK